MANLGSRSFAITYTTIDFPGSLETQATGISGSNIVGIYKDATSYHGFLYGGTSFTTLNDPKATKGTFARGISNGKIVGNYYDAQGSHGFVYDGLTYATFDDPAAALTTVVPGESGTFANGIDNGRIVGFYEDNFTKQHGFIYDGTTFTHFDVPGTFSTGISGIDGQNIVGWYLGLDSKSHSYLYDGANVITLDLPFGSFGDFAGGIDGKYIVGGYHNELNGGGHGFIYDGSTSATFDVPAAGPQGTFAAMGIDGNKIVGSFYDSSGKLRGFLATIPEPTVSSLVACSSLAMLRRTRRRSMN
jgi:hypothetical protein